jgi:hypothetical protein
MVRHEFPIPEKTMIPARYEIRGLGEEVASGEQFRESGEVFFNTKHKNAEAAALVPSSSDLLCYRRR